MHRKVIPTSSQKTLIDLILTFNQAYKIRRSHKIKLCGKLLPVVLGTWQHRRAVSRLINLGCGSGMTGCIKNSQHFYHNN